jgi:hypothetical protein
VSAARLTRGSGSSSWPTATSQDGKQGGITPFQAKGGNHTNLLHVAAINEEQKNWPTISVNESKNSVGKSQLDRNSVPLATMAVMQDSANWPTPDAHQFGSALGANQKSPATITHAVKFWDKHGQAAPASSSSHGSRQGLWLTLRANEPDSDPNFAARNADRGAHCHGTLSSQAKETWWTPQVQDSKHSGTNPTANGERDLLVNQVNWMTPRACEAQNPPMGVDKRHHGLTHQVTKQWATPCSRDHHPNGQADGSKTDLGNQVTAQWATPQAHDAQGPKTPEQIAVMRAKGHGVKNLNEQAQWGTPTARDHKSGRGNEEREYKELTPMVERQQTGKLNPRWVETLMGLPIGWTMPSCTSPVTIAPTSCDSSGTALCQPAQSEHSDFLLAS